MIHARFQVRIVSIRRGLLGLGGYDLSLKDG
jgi:hypothetical protein